MGLRERQAGEIQLTVDLAPHREPGTWRSWLCTLGGQRTPGWWCCHRPCTDLPPPCFSRWVTRQP